MRGKPEKPGGKKPARRGGGGGESRCREILRRLCADAGKSESSPFCREIARHLEKCEKCRAQAISLRGTVELYRCLEGEDVPDEVARKLKATLGLGPSSK